MPNYHQAWGGAEQVAYRYIRLLVDSGKVEVLVGSVKPQKEVNENFKFFRIRVVEDFFPAKYHVYITGLKNRLLSFDPLSFFYLIYLFIKEKPDVVHIHKINKISFSAILAAKLVGLKTVMGIYDYWYFCPAGMLIDQKGNLCVKFHGAWCKNCDAVGDFRFLLSFMAPIRRQIFDFFYRHVDAFAVLSAAQEKFLQRYGISKKKIFLVRQVFNFNQQKTNNTKINNNMILFTGWLDQRKGLHVVIEAMPKILKNLPMAKLFVLKLEGIKSYEDKIMERISELKLDNNIIFFGRLTKEEFQKYLKEAAVVVVPEQWENMSPVIVVEGMANGKVMVASKIGGIPEFIDDGKNGFLVERDKSDDWADKIVRILKNQKKAQEIGEQAKKDIEKLCNQEKILKDLLKLYERINEKSTN